MTGFNRAEPLLPDPSITQELIYPLIAEDLARVEAMFRENLESPLEIVDEIGTFIGAGGGKRVRPTLHLLCARLCDYPGPHDILLATVLEFIHSATLIHDDIIDEAKTRRGRESVNRRWGNNVTVLFGDYLFAKAMEMALQAGSLEVMRKLAEVTLRMTEGEMLQTRYVGRLDLTMPEYLDLVERKTAALFACCCELAGMLAGVSRRRLRALRSYGTNLGMAFQVVDDLLDFTGDSLTLGKPAGSDLRDGKATLAVIELLGTQTPAAEKGRSLARKVMEHGQAGSPEIGELTALLDETGCLDRSRRRAEAYAGAAIETLESFPQGVSWRALRSLPDLLLSRDR